jgi:hypothetical protein
MASRSSPALFWRRRAAALALFFGVTSVSCLGHPAYLTVPATPYDHQMARVHPLLATADKAPGSISLLAVNQWMTELHAMPYQYFHQWQTPAEVNLARAADCKGKAVALYAQMRRNGAQHLRIVIGKHYISHSATHAWLEWDRPEGSLMLDPTFNELPIKTTELDPMTYVPLYAYDGARKYRAANADFFAPTTRVASGYSNHSSVSAATGTSFVRPRLTGVGSRGFSPATSQYLNRPRPTLATQYSWASARSLSAPNVAGVRRTGVPVVNPNTQYLVSAHGMTAVSQKNLRLTIPHSTLTVVKHPSRGLAHREHRVIPSRSKELASSS